MSLPGLPLERGVSGINANPRDVVLSWLEKQKDISLEDNSPSLMRCEEDAAAPRRSREEERTERARAANRQSRQARVKARIASFDRGRPAGGMLGRVPSFERRQQARRASRQAQGEPSKQQGDAF